MPREAAATDAAFCQDSPAGPTSRTKRPSSRSSVEMRCPRRSSHKWGTRVPGCPVSAGGADEQDKPAGEQMEGGDALPAPLKPQMGDARPRLSGERLRFLEKL